MQRRNLLTNLFLAPVLIPSTNLMKLSLRSSRLIVPMPIYRLQFRIVIEDQEINNDIYPISIDGDDLLKMEEKLAEALSDRILRRDLRHGCYEISLRL